jgi:hypothetical protein
MGSFVLVPQGDLSMFCPQCGKPLAPSAQFCSSCGASADAAAPAIAPLPVQTVAPRTVRPALGARLGAMKTWKKVVLGIVAGFVLLATVTITLAFWLTGGLADSVDRHFAALKAGNFDAAYAELAVATRNQNTPAEFKAMIGNNPMLTHVVGGSFSSRSYTSGQGELIGELELEGGGRLPITVHLVKENDQWKILSYHVGPQPNQ